MTSSSVKSNAGYIDIPFDTPSDGDDRDKPETYLDGLEDQKLVVVREIDETAPLQSHQFQTRSGISACSFVLGFVIGAIVVSTGLTYNNGVGGFRLVPVSNSDYMQQPNKVDKKEKSAVSYNFLRTSRGSSTIRILLNDLINPTPERYTEKSNTTETVNYELLGGPRRALMHLSQLMETDGQIHSQCHPLAHSLGRAAYQYFGSLDAAYDGMVGTDDAKLLRVCNAAYLHGVIESHLRSVENSSDLTTVAAEIEKKVCLKLSNVEIGTWECRHGIGHGIIQRNRMDVETIAVQMGIATCEKTFKKAGKAECENGLWMDHFESSGHIIAMERSLMAMDIVASEFENALSSLKKAKRSNEIPHNEDTLESELEVKGQFLTPPLPPTLRMCQDFAHADLDECYVYAPTEYLLVHPGDYVGALAYCQDPSAKITSSAIRYCVTGVGMQCGKENMDDFFIVEKVCQTLDDVSLGIDCFRTALSYYTMSTGGESPRDAGVCDKLVQFHDLCR